MNALHTSNRLNQATGLMSVLALASSRVEMCVAASLSSPAVHSDSIERPVATLGKGYDASFIATGLLGKTQSQRGLGNWQQADRNRNRGGRVKLN